MLVWAGEQLRPHFKALVEVAAAGLRDASDRVRAAALSSVSTLVQWVAEEPEVRCFRELVPSMLQVSRSPVCDGLCLPKLPPACICYTANLPISSVLVMYVSSTLI